MSRNLATSRLFTSSTTLTLLAKMFASSWLVLFVVTAQTWMLLPAQADESKRSPAEETASPPEFDFRVEPDNSPSPNTAKYLVFVNQDSPLTLQEVQQIEPTAFEREYKGNRVIQAGIFGEPDNAQQLAIELESRGITARVASLATGAETDFRLNSSRSYFVIIPAPPADLPGIADQVTRVGGDAQVVVSQRSTPSGSHVRVGPFSKYRQVFYWNLRLLKSGLRNARIYYGR